jgi:hypothetical protein
MKRHIRPDESEARRSHFLIEKEKPRNQSWPLAGPRASASISPALDNVFIERIRRSVKHELTYRGDFANGVDQRAAPFQRRQRIGGRDGNMADSLLLSTMLVEKSGQAKIVLGLEKENWRVCISNRSSHQRLQRRRFRSALGASR